MISIMLITQTCWHIVWRERREGERYNNIFTKSVDNNNSNNNELNNDDLSMTIIPNKRWVLSMGMAMGIYPCPYSISTKNWVPLYGYSWCINMFCYFENKDNFISNF